MSQTPEGNPEFCPQQPTDQEPTRVSEKLDNFESLLPSAAGGENTLYSNVSRSLGTKTCPMSEACHMTTSETTSEAPSPSGSGSSRGRASSKVCEVCGDKAKSFHFGGVSCDSCKAFFRRAVQSDSHNSFRCPYDGSCVITVATRKTCQACRFKRCLHIGMEKKWVMNEDERSTFQKHRQEKKMKFRGSEHRTQGTSANPSANSTVGSFEPDVADMLKYMSSDDQNEIETLVTKIHQSYIDIPYKVSQSSQSRNSIEIIEMFTTILRRMVYFHKNLSDFSQLSQEDQSILLRQGVLEMCMLRSALTYDFKNNRWPIQRGNMEFLRDCPVLRVEDMKKLVSPDLYDMQMRFISGIQELNADEPIVTLLTLIVLFSPDRTGLLNQKTVGIVQDKYLRHLKNYILWRFGSHGSIMYPKFLTKLSDLRQLNDSHNEYNLRLAQREVNQIQEQLSSINLNPYTHWDMVKCDENKAVGHVNPSSGPGTGTSQRGTGMGSVSPTDSPGAIPRDPSYVPEKMQTLRMPQPPVPTTTSHNQPSMAGILFSQIVNKQIPILIEEFQDPVSVISTDHDLARVSKLFMPRGPPMLSKMEEPTFFIPTIAQRSTPSFVNTSVHVGYEPQARIGDVGEPLGSSTGVPQKYAIEYSQAATSQQNPKCYSALKNILECIGEISDPNFLQQVKQSLSPEVLKQLQNAFAPSTTMETQECSAPPPTSTTPTYIPQTGAVVSEASLHPSISTTHISFEQDRQPGVENQGIQRPNPLISHQIQNILQSFGYQNSNVEVRSSDCSTTDVDNEMASHPNFASPQTFSQSQAEASSYCGSFAEEGPVSGVVEDDYDAAIVDDQEVMQELVPSPDVNNLISQEYQSCSKK